MNLNERIGRVLMVAPPDDWLERDHGWLEEFHPAGVILFRRHLPATFEKARQAIASLRTSAGGVLLVAADEEGGFVAQTSQLFPVPPSARALARGGSPQVVRRVFGRYAARLRALGVDLDFAPVCDVNVNPRNPVIGARSFGADPSLVLDYARAVHEGLAGAGVLSCLKHFPGHGDTEVDSHLALPVLPHARARLDAVELVPFKALLAVAPAVMVAHLACPQLGGGDAPATLSPRLVTDLLRHELGYQGVVITDAMEMEGVAGVADAGEAAVQALDAGCDLLLYCFGLERVAAARAALGHALETGRLPAARLEAAAARVAALQRQVAEAPRNAPALPEFTDDARLYAELCRRALRVEDESGWRALWHRRGAGPLELVGRDETLLLELAQRLERRGVECQRKQPEAALAPAAARIVVVAERRPMDEETLSALRRVAAASPAGLANLLTPEVDAPLAGAFPVRMQSADRSAVMLDVVVERWLELGG